MHNNSAACCGIVVAGPAYDTAASPPHKCTARGPIRNIARAHLVQWVEAHKSVRDVRLILQVVPGRCACYIQTRRSSSIVTHRCYTHFRVSATELLPSPVTHPLECWC